MLIVAKRALLISLLLSTTTTCAMSDDLAAFIGTWQVKVVYDEGESTEFRLTVRDDDGTVSVHARINESDSESERPPLPEGYCGVRSDGGILTASASGDQVQAKVETVRTIVGDDCEGVETGVEQVHTSGEMSGKRTAGGDGFNGTWSVELFGWECADLTNEACVKYERKEEVEERCTVEIRSLVDADISVSCDEWEADCGEVRVDGSLDGDHFSATVTFVDTCKQQADDNVVKITADRQ